MIKLETAPSDPEACRAMRAERRQTLLAPMDDMWAAFAEMANWHTIQVGGEPVGFFSLNGERELHAFYLRPAQELAAEAILQEVIAKHGVRAALPATVDPAFTCLAMDHAREVSVKAILFHHVVQPGGRALESLREAGEEDRAAAIAFEEAATGAPLAFLDGYVGARIAAGELLLHEVEGAITGVGELRRDASNPGHAHLGVIVGAEQRGQGLGSAIMRYLVEESGRQGLAPICSTEPTNSAARRVIERAGFRPRHRVVRFSFASE